MSLSLDSVKAVKVESFPYVQNLPLKLPRRAEEVKAEARNNNTSQDIFPLRF